MKTRNMPYAQYQRRVSALERLSSWPTDRGYRGSNMGKYEEKTLDERIKGYAESGQRPSTTLGTS